VLYTMNKTRLMCFALTGSWGVALLSSAIAAPKISSGRSSFSAIDAARSLTAASRSFSHQEHPLIARLDLRPPRESTPSTMHVGAGALALASFPSGTRPSGLAKENLGTTEGNRFPELRTGELNFQMMSQSEILVRRVRRQGLPVARLWESKSALVSIGLNQKGKPGLWLTQRIH